MRKASTQEFYCVFPDSVEKLYERDWGTPGKAWKDVCNTYTSTSDGCVDVGYTAFLDVCKHADSQNSCLAIDDKPKTISDCRDKYFFAYLVYFPLEDRGDPISIGEYATERCDLHPYAVMHGEYCQQWWDRYQEISKNDTHQISELGFIAGYCIEVEEPDWNSWGEFRTSDPKSDKVQNGEFGPIDRYIYFAAMWDCIEEPCYFLQQNGVNSTIQCEKGWHHYVYTPQFVYDPQTQKYSCETMLHPWLDCPDYKHYNGTHYYDVWFDDNTLRYGCTLIEYIDFDRDGLEDEYDQCPDIKEDSYEG
ncbi:MAG: hypothetical protein D9C04_04835, partial [Nitrosopumilus sp. B06]